MNWSQIAGILRIAGPALVGVLAQTGVISDSLATNLSAFILTAAGSAALSAYSNTTLNLATTVSEVKGVKVHVDETAPLELQKAAADRAVPDIVPEPPPTVSPYIANPMRR